MMHSGGTWGGLGCYACTHEESVTIGTLLGDKAGAVALRQAASGRLRGQEARANHFAELARSFRQPQPVSLAHNPLLLQWSSAGSFTTSLTLD